MSDTAAYTEHPPQAWLTVLVRLWTLRQVRSAPAGNSTQATLIMALAWLSAWIAIDRWQSQPQPQFFADGIPLLAWYVLAILGLAALLRWRARPAPAFGPVLALTMGTVPVPLLFVSLVADYLQPSWVLGAAIIVG